MTKKSRPPHLALNDTVAAAIAQEILSERYLPGAVLPTEATTAKRLGVSRTVVREAMKRLTAKGLVEPRKRRGTVVRPRTSWNMLDPELLRWWETTGPLAQFVRSILEMRMIFEPAAAELAARRGNTRNLAQIQQAYQRMEGVAGHAELSIEPDVEYHRAILEATGNDLLRSLGVLLEAALRNIFRISSSYKAGLEITLSDHRAVMTAILKRNPALARRNMTQLLEKTQAHLEGSLRSISNDHPSRSAPRARKHAALRQNVSIRR